MAQEGVSKQENAVIPKEVKVDDKVKPFDTVKVYSTGSSAGFFKEGDVMDVHPLLAKKLVDYGKATEKAPSKK